MPPPRKDGLRLRLLPAGATIFLEATVCHSPSCSQCTTLMHRTTLCLHSSPSSRLTSALLALATGKVTFLSGDPSAVDKINVFSPSFSTVLPSAVVSNAPRLDSSDSTVLWFGHHVLGKTVDHQWLGHGRPLAGYLAQWCTSS